jgi:hypothetical protein
VAVGLLHNFLWQKQQSLNFYVKIKALLHFCSCRGRGRTYTGQLDRTQSLVVNPGRPWLGRLYVIFYPVITTPETRGHVCQDFITPQYKELFLCLRGQYYKKAVIYCKYSNDKFENIENIY